MSASDISVLRADAVFPLQLLLCRVCSATPHLKCPALPVFGNLDCQSVVELFEERGEALVVDRDADRAPT